MERNKGQLGVKPTEERSTANTAMATIVNVNHEIIWMLEIGARTRVGKGEALYYRITFVPAIR